MTQGQSRAEFEAWARGESPSINLTREGDGYRYSLAEMLYGAWQAVRAAAPASQGWKLGQPITEDMHVAACKVLTRAHGLAGLPQRMLDAMLSAAPQPPAAPALPPTLNDAMRAVLINEHDVYQTPEALYEALLAAPRGGEEATNPAETRMDTGVGRGCEVLPEVVEKALHWIDCDTREHVRDCIARNSDPNDIYGSLDQLERILRAAPSVPQGWIPVEERLPEPGKPVLLDIGKKYPIRAMWAARFTLEAGDDDPSWGEYNEDGDMYYCPEGWYEWNEHEDTHWRVSVEPLRWAELSQPPKEQG